MATAFLTGFVSLGLAAGPGTAVATDPAPAPVGAANRLFGLLDPAWGLLGHDDSGHPILDPAALGPYVNKVYGTVQDVTGQRMPNTRLVLELVPPIPQDQPVPTSIGLATGITDSTGAFVLEVPTTQEVLDAAEFANGTVNMWLSGFRYDGTGHAHKAWTGGGMIFTSMVAYGGGLGFAIAPVNIGTLTITSTLALVGAPSLPDTPPDDPEDPAVADDRDAELPAGVGDAIDGLPVASEPYVPVPTVASDTHVVVPTEWPSYPMPTPEENEDSNGGDSRCSKPANEGTWLVDAQTFQNRWQPVGEVHGWLGMRTRYDYSDRADSSIAAKVKAEGGSWELAGRSSITNDASFGHNIPERADYVRNPVEAEFVHVHERRTWCPWGYDPVDGPYASHQERIYSTTWAGGLRYGTRELGGDGWDAYRKAKAEGRSMTMYQWAEVYKNTGKTYKYSLGVTAFGVGLDIESNHNSSHMVTIKTTDRLKDWHLFGNKGVPKSPANKAIYVSG